MKMNYKNLFSTLHEAQEPVILVAQMCSASRSAKASREDLAEAWLALATAFKRNQRGRSLSVTRALLVLVGADKFITRIQRDGVFRSSKYDFYAPSVQNVIDDLTVNSASYRLTNQHVEYLRSVSSLWSLATELKNQRISLVKRMRQRRNCVIKTLLANIDIMFTYGVPGDRLADTDSPYAYSSETMAEAFSYLLHLFEVEIGLTFTNFGLVDESSIYSPFYQTLLIDAAKLCEYLEVEVFIDAFPYKAEISQDGGVLVSAQYPNLEKSIRIGYVQSDMQKQLRLGALINELSNENGTIQSVTQLAHDCFTSLGERIVTYVQSPHPRYVAMWPMDPRLFEPFSGNGLFLEDLSSLEMLGTEDYVKPFEIIESSVVGNITVIDILKVQRFFHFLRFGIQLAIDKHSPTYERPDLHLSSCLPVFEKSKLLMFMECIIGKEKSEELLKLLTCDLGSEYVDLQYTPFLKTGKWYMVSLVVLTSSNLVRNVLCHHAQRLTMRGSENKDPMQASLKNALCKAGFNVEDEVEVGPKSNPLETDILAYKDNQLFLFECKNSFHPCNVYEMRTSYGHVTYAAEQLTKRAAWLKNSENQRRLFQKLGWEISVPVKIHTCIAIGNRVFNGYECDGHPVRQVHEILNMISGGTIRINGVSRRVWSNSEFSTDDLVRHLEGTTVIADFMNSTRPLNRKLVFGAVALNISSYMLDTDHLTSLGEARYPSLAPATT